MRGKKVGQRDERLVVNARRPTLGAWEKGVGKRKKKEKGDEDRGGSRLWNGEKKEKGGKNKWTKSETANCRVSKVTNEYARKRKYCVQGDGYIRNKEHINEGLAYVETMMNRETRIFRSITPN